MVAPVAKRIKYDYWLCLLIYVRTQTSMCKCQLVIHTNNILCTTYPRPFIVYSSLAIQYHVVNFYLIFSISGLLSRITTHALVGDNRNSVHFVAESFFIVSFHPSCAIRFVFHFRCIIWTKEYVHFDMSAPVERWCLNNMNDILQRTVIHKFYLLYWTCTAIGLHWFRLWLGATHKTRHYRDHIWRS